MPSLRPIPANITHPQRARLARFGGERSVDIHCHCLPGVDDGPPTMEDAVALCRVLARDGFTDIISTPHELGRWDNSNQPLILRSVVKELQNRLDAERIPLNIYPGAEVRIDERIPKLLASDGIMTMADSQRYLLLELPPVGKIDPAIVMPHMTAANIRVILAHAERYSPLCDDHNAASEWLDAGACLQLNATSVVGGSGKESMDACWDWLRSGWISLIATDTHSINSRRPRMTEAVEMIARELGDEVARTVCLDNPLKVLKGETLAAL